MDALSIGKLYFCRWGWEIKGFFGILSFLFGVYGVLIFKIIFFLSFYLSLVSLFLLLFPFFSLFLRISIVSAQGLGGFLLGLMMGKFLMIKTGGEFVT